MQEVEEKIKEEDPKISLLDVIQAEVTELMKTSQEIRLKIESAKTNVKKRLYEKKLKKNNHKLMEMLMAAEKIRKRRETDDGTKQE